MDPALDLIKKGEKVFLWMSSFCLIWRFIISYYPPVQDCTKGDMGSNKE